MWRLLQLLIGIKVPFNLLNNCFSPYLDVDLYQIVFNRDEQYTRSLQSSLYILKNSFHVISLRKQGIAQNQKARYQVHDARNVCIVSQNLKAEGNKKETHCETFLFFLFVFFFQMLKSLINCFLLNIIHAHSSVYLKILYRLPDALPCKSYTSLDISNRRKAKLTITFLGLFDPSVCYIYYTYHKNSV